MSRKLITEKKINDLVSIRLHDSETGKTTNRSAKTVSNYISFFDLVLAFISLVCGRKEKREYNINGRFKLILKKKS